MNPADELRTAAQKIRALTKPIHAPDQSWHTEECADDERGNCPCIVAQGVCNTDDGFVQPVYYVADAETPECAAYIAAMGPPVALALANLLDDQADGDDEGVVSPWSLAAARAINGPGGEMTDQPTLRQRVARAILRYDSRSALSGNDIPSKHHYGEADFVLAELRAELAASDPELQRRLEAAIEALGKSETELAHVRAQRTRVTDLYERWVEAGPPPFGTSMSRWWDTRLAELAAALNPTKEEGS